MQNAATIVRMVQNETVLHAVRPFQERAPVVCARGPRTGQGRLVAIDTVSFDLQTGSLVSLLGPSGCGKTTFLKIVAGLIEATSGTIQINGIDVTGPQSDFGVAFQQANLMPWRSVLEERAVPDGNPRRRTAAQRVSARWNLLELVGLEDFEDAYPAQLSGGMQQRVALCRALIHRPKLLLMDEPFGALDELTRMEMQDLLLDIRAKTGATVMFVTHSISEAIYLSDTVVVFSKRPAVIADLDRDRRFPIRARRRSATRHVHRASQHRAGALGITR